MEVCEEVIAEAAEAINCAEGIFITAGAGMGVDSGLPDFRGDEGFWRAYPLLREEGLSFQDLANPYWFERDPYRAWGFYGHRFKLYQKTVPHQGFSILKNWADKKAIETFVFTSNVDGHFQKAGFQENSIFECHGSINFLQCSDGCSNDIWPLTHLNLEIDETKLLAKGSLPRCPKCNSIARPNILMFGDYGWIADRSALQNDRYSRWKAQCLNKKIVVIELGAGKAIPTVRNASQAMSAKIIRINPRDSDGPHGVISMPAGALEALSRISES